MKMKEDIEVLTSSGVFSIIRDEVVKIEIIDDWGMGVWFNESIKPSIVMPFPDNEMALESMNSFSRALNKSKMRVIKQ